MELENRELCAECGGQCCKQAGCTYSANDLLVVNANSIKELLNQGYTSICADVTFDLPKKLTLSLKARNTGADIIDLISYTKECMALTETGCKYTFDKRPSGGKYLIPHKKKICDYDEIDILDIVATWLPYQDLLKSICEELSERKFEELLSEKVEEYFYQNYRRGVLDENMFNAFRTYFPKEDHKAINRVFDINDSDTLHIKMIKMF